jgi:hypothetical protein
VNNILKAIEGTLESTNRPMCMGCGMDHGLDMVNARPTELPCGVCGKPTTWRVAVQDDAVDVTTGDC